MPDQSHSNKKEENTINDLPGHAFNGREVTPKNPASGAIRDYFHETLPIAHVDGANYIYDPETQRVILGLRDPITPDHTWHSSKDALGRKRWGWERGLGDYKILYTELAPHELVIELQTIPSEIEVIKKAYQDSFLLLKGPFTTDELLKVLRHDPDALSEEVMRKRIHAQEQQSGLIFDKQEIEDAIALRKQTTRESLEAAFGIEKATPEQIAEYQQRSEKRKENYNQNILRKNQIAASYENDTKITGGLLEDLPPGREAIWIQQHEFSISKAGIIGTNCLQRCIALVIHDPTNQTAALAHIDTATDIQSIRTMFALMDSGNPLDVYVMRNKDGVHAAEGITTAGEVLEFVEQYARQTGKNIQIKGIGFTQGPEFSFDAATGQMIKKSPPVPSDAQAEERYRRAINDPRVRKQPLMPHEIGDVSINDFPNVDAFHAHLRENASALRSRLPTARVVAVPLNPIMQPAPTEAPIPSPAEKVLLSAEKSPGDASPTNKPAVPEPDLLAQTRQKQGMKPPSHGLGGAMMGTVGRAIFVEGIITGKAFHDPLSGTMTTGGAVNDGLALTATHYAQEAARYEKLLVAAKEANDTKKITELSAKAARYSQRAGVFGAAAENLNRVLGPVGGVLEFHTATQVNSPTLKVAHGVLGAGFIAEAPLAAAGLGGPLAPLLLVGGAGVALADPWFEMTDDVAKSYKARAEKIYLGNEAGVDASKLKSYTQEYSQLQKTKVDLDIKSDDHDQMRNIIQAKISQLKMTQDYKDVASFMKPFKIGGASMVNTLWNVTPPGIAIRAAGNGKIIEEAIEQALGGTPGKANNYLAVLLYEKALIELGTAKPGEMFAHRWQDEKGEWQEEKRFTYASRNHAAQQLKQKDPERAQKLESYISSLMTTAVRTGDETSKQRIAEEIVKELTTVQKEFEKLAGMSSIEREAYLNTNAQFLREAGIPRHSALSGALLTYDNLVEKAASVGKTLDQLGMKGERGNAEQATWRYKRELLGRLKEEGKIAVYELDRSHDAISLKTDNPYHKITDADRLALAHLMIQERARGIGKLELFEDLSERQAKDIRQDIQTRRYLNGREVFENLLAQRGRESDVPTAYGKSPRRFNQPEHVIDALDQSNHPAPLLKSLVALGDPKVMERVANYYGTPKTNLKKAGIAIHSEQPETRAQFQADLALAIHEGKLKAEAARTTATLLSGETTPVFRFSGTTEEALAFERSLQNMGIRYHSPGAAMPQRQKIEIRAKDIEKFLPQGLTHERMMHSKDSDVNGNGRLSAGKQEWVKIVHRALKSLLSEKDIAAIDAIQTVAVVNNIKLDPNPAPLVLHPTNSAAAAPSQVENERQVT